MTIIDVARAAGVAPSTVSYVLNGKRPISADTRRHVEQCIRDLGYRRTSASRVRTNVLGLLAPLRSGVNVAEVSRFVSATMVAARARDYDLLLLTAGVTTVRRATVADALIVLDAPALDAAIPALLTLDRPVVLVGTPDRPTGLAGVDYDFGPAADRAVEHLANLGHRRIGVVGAPLPANAQRAGHARRFTWEFETRAAKRGMPVLRRACGESDEAIRSCLDALFAESPGITGLLVENEFSLSGVVEQLRRRGRRVPEDISIVAVGQDGLADRPPIRLTSVAVPTTRLGELAVDLALRQLDAPAEPEVRLVKPGLTVRESTGPAPVTVAGAGC